MARSKNDLELLSINELWELHQKVLATLRAKIKAQTKMLEQRLKQVNARLRDNRLPGRPDEVGCRRFMAVFHFFEP